MKKDLHITNNDGPEAWLPVIEAIKNEFTGPFQGTFALMVKGKPVLHITSDFIVELLEDYVEKHKKL